MIDELGHVVYPRIIYSSPAFLVLTKIALHVLFQFRLKCQMVKLPGKKGRKKPWIIKNNGKLTYTFREAHELLGLSKQSFTDAIDSLIENGFLEITRLGGGISRIPNQYALVNIWHYWGTPQFKIKPRPKDKRRKGRIENFQKGK